MNHSPPKPTPLLTPSRVLRRSQQRRATRRLVTLAIVTLLLGLLLLAQGCASPAPIRCEPLKPMPVPALSQSPSMTPYSTQWQKLVDESRLRLINGSRIP